MNREEIRQFKSLLKQGSLRHMNIILDDKFQKSLLKIIKDYEEKDKQITQLTNNWNKLEKIILKEIEKCKEDEKIIRQNKIPKFYEIGVCAGIHGTCKFILDKMKKIKENNNV